MLLHFNMLQLATQLHFINKVAATVFLLILIISNKWLLVTKAVADNVHLYVASTISMCTETESQKPNNTEIIKD